MDIITNWQLIHGKISLIFLLGMVPEIWSITDRIFFILDHFLPFYLSNNTKNQNFENLKKTLGDIIILHTHTKNHDHITHCSLDMVHNGCHFYFLFWAIFCPFTSLTAKKSKLKKKKKKKKMSGDIILQQCTKNHDHMLYCSNGMWQMQLFFILGHFLHFYPPDSPKKENLKKMKKTPEDIIILQKCIKNHDHMLYTVPEI